MGNNRYDMRLTKCSISKPAESAPEQRICSTSIGLFSYRGYHSHDKPRV